MKGIFWVARTEGPPAGLRFVAARFRIVVGRRVFRSSSAIAQA